MTHVLNAPKDEIPYPNNGGLGGAYIDSKAANRISRWEGNLPQGWVDKYKYRVEVMGGFAPDAGIYCVCCTDDLEVAAQAWKAWSKVAETMVAVIDRDTWDQVEPYGYG